MGGVMQKTLAVALLAGMAGSIPAVLAQDKAADEVADLRTPVVLRPAERTRVLNDMRQYLTGMQEMFTALAKEDMAAVAAKAKEMGTINIYERVVNSQAKAGGRFRQLSSLVHEEFDSIAANAQTSKDTKATLLSLSMTMKYCVTCHENFRLVESAHSK